jgi:hypothetical protein
MVVAGTAYPSSMMMNDGNDASHFVGTTKNSRNPHQPIERP